MNPANLFAALLGLSGVAQAAPAVTFDGAFVASRMDYEYQCQGGTRLRVQYVNTVAGDSLAYLPAGGADHIFVAGPSGSGVRYVSGTYVWWTKGRGARLTREGDEQGSALLDGCQVADPTPDARPASVR
jgi:membrane-bound inhibitor of C-type lysozyme